MDRTTYLLSVLLPILSLVALALALARARHKYRNRRSAQCDTRRRGSHRRGVERGSKARPGQACARCLNLKVGQT
jgi:hypothetical protein